MSLSSSPGDFTQRILPQLVDFDSKTLQMLVHSQQISLEQLMQVLQAKGTRTAQHPQATYAPPPEASCIPIFVAPKPLAPRHSPYEIPQDEDYKEKGRVPDLGQHVSIVNQEHSLLLFRNKLHYYEEVVHFWKYVWTKIQQVVDYIDEPWDPNFDPQVQAMLRTAMEEKSLGGRPTPRHTCSTLNTIGYQMDKWLELFLRKRTLPAAWMDPPGSRRCMYFTDAPALQTKSQLHGMPNERMSSMTSLCASGKRSRMRGTILIPSSRNGNGTLTQPMTTSNSLRTASDRRRNVN